MILNADKLTMKVSHHSVIPRSHKMLIKDAKIQVISIIIVSRVNSNPNLLSNVI